MSETLGPNPTLPGLESGSSAPPPPPVLAAAPARPRVQPVDRSQLVWRTVDVEQLIEPDHPARAIWSLTGQLDLSAFYAPIAAVEGRAGRTPWDPRLLISLWIYAYSRGIGAARELARRCVFEPAFQWLTGLAEINYHTLSDFRVAHDTALQDIFVQVLGVLSAEGLVPLERVMHDGTKIKACAGADSFRREERLQQHLDAARQQVQAMGDPRGEESPRQRAARQRGARERQARLEQAQAALEKIRAVKNGAEAQAQARVSLSDPEARVMKQSDGGYAPSYNVQLSTDAAHTIIVGAGVSQCGSDYGELVGGVQRVEQNLEQKPAQMVADGGFTSRENIVALAAQGVDFIGSLGEHQNQAAGQLRRRGVAAAFYPEAFAYDAAQDCYRCPAGQTLRHESQEQRPGVVQHQYRAEAALCAACPLKAQCCPQNGSKGRSLTRAVEAPAVRAFVQKMQTPEAKAIYRQRGPIAEFPNAWIKAKLGLRQFHVRGLAKALLEVLWACLAYDLAQWIRLCWRPSSAAAAS
jgi:transposase